MRIHMNGTSSSNGHPRLSVYLDHAATTPVLPQVLEAMLPYFTEKSGNPSSVHAWGRSAHQGMEAARRQVVCRKFQKDAYFCRRDGGVTSLHTGLVIGARHASLRSVPLRVRS